MYPFRFQLPNLQLQELPFPGPPRQMAQDCRGAQHRAKGAEDRVRPEAEHGHKRWSKR